MSDVMERVVFGGASELRLRVGITHLEAGMRFHRNPLGEAKHGLPKGLRRTLFPGQKDKLISHTPRIGGVEKMKKRSSVFPMALAGITAAAVCFGVPWSAASAQNSSTARVTATRRRPQPAPPRPLPCPMVRAK